MPGGTIPKFAWPVIIDGTNGNIWFDEVPYGGAPGPWTATIAPGTYHWRGTDLAGDLQWAIEAALNAAGGGPPNPVNTYTVRLQENGTLEIYGDVAQFRIHWAHANTTFQPRLAGFDAINQEAVADPIWQWRMNSDFQVWYAWFPEQCYIQDSEDRPRYRANQQIMVDGSSTAQQWGERFHREITVDILPPHKVFAEFEVRTQEGFLAQRLGSARPSTWISQGLPFEFCPDFVTAPTGYKIYIPDGAEFLRWQAFSLHTELNRLWQISIPLLRYVS